MTAIFLHWAAALFVGSSADSATPMLSDIVRSWRKSADSILSSPEFTIQFSITTSVPMNDGKYGRHFGNLDITNSIRGGDVFVELFDRGDEGRKVATFHRRVAWKNGVCVNLANEKLMMINPEPDGQVWIWWHFTDNMFLNVYKRLPLPQALKNDPPVQWKQPFLPEAVEGSPSEYTVLPKNEAVDGVQCVVVERKGVDRIWADPQRNFTVLRRQTHWGIGQPVSAVVTLSQHRPFSEGVWIPWKQVVDTYADPRFEKKSVWGKIINRRTFELKKMELKAVPEATFRISAPSGTFVYDKIQDIEYLVQPADSLPFEKAIAVGAEEVSRRRFRSSLFYGLGILAAIVATATYVKRIRSRRRRV